MRFSDYILNENNLYEFDIKSAMKKVSALFKRRGNEASKSGSDIKVSKGGN